jgi:hypothetical protein
LFYVTCGVTPAAAKLGEGLVYSSGIRFVSTAGLRKGIGSGDALAPGDVMTDEVLPIIPEEDYLPIRRVIEDGDSPQKLPATHQAWCLVIEARAASGVLRQQTVTLRDFQDHMALINSDPLKPRIQPSIHAMFQCAANKAGPVITPTV